MTEEAKFCVESCRGWYQAFANHGKGEERSVKELLTTADLIESLSEQLDAAVRDMGMTAHCDICAHHRNNGGNCIGVSMCGQRRPRWQWRGVEVNNDAQKGSDAKS